MQTKNQKREAAPLLVAAWRALTPAQQLASLDDRLGKGVGAKRQRVKLDKILHPSVKPVEIPVIVVTGNVAEPPKKRFKKGNKQ